MRYAARQLQHGFDQMLGLGAGNQHCGRHHEVEPPKLLMSGDVLRRHAGCALGEHFVVASFFFSREFALRMRVKISTIGAEDEHKQDLGIHAR